MAVLTVDRAVFEAEVKKYVDLSPVFKEWNDVKVLQWPAALVPPQLWITVKEFGEFIGAACAAVEIAKHSLLTQADPGGARGLKIDKEMALTAAVNIVFASVKFNGIIGKIVSMLWKPFLNIMLSLYVNKQESNWINVALGILKLASI